MDECGQLSHGVGLMEGISKHPADLQEMTTVLVCFSCHNKIPQTAGSNIRKLFSHISGGWKAKIKALAGPVASEASLLGLQTATLLLLFTWSSLCPQESSLSLSLSAVSFYFFSVCILISSSYKDLPN